MRAAAVLAGLVLMSSTASAQPPSPPPSRPGLDLPALAERLISHMALQSGE